MATHGARPGGEPGAVGPVADPETLSIMPRRLSWTFAALLLFTVSARGGENLLPDPSFEQPQTKDQFGHVFAKWSGWIYEGDCEFRVSDLARQRQALLADGRQR